jgi:hypothetical protein
MRLEDEDYPYYSNGIDLTYRFNWKRIAHGVPVDNDGIRVSVDATTGQVVNYYLSWNKQALLAPPTANVKSSDEVLDSIMDNLGVYPTYQPKDNYQGQQIELLYKVNSNLPSFDAYSGKPVNIANQQQSFQDAKLFNQQFTFQMDEAKPADSVDSQPVDMAGAQRIAENFFKQLGYQDKVRRTGGGGSSGPGYTLEYWAFSLENNKENDVRLEINRANGAVVGFSLQTEAVKNNGRAISHEQATASAEKFLNMLGYSKDQYTIAERNQYNNPLLNQERYRLEYVAILNGVPNQLDTKVIEIDPFTGQVTNYRCRTEGLLPKVNTDPNAEIIDQQAAVAAYKIAKPIKLTYLYGRDENYQPQQEAKLVYLLTDRGIDAYTGEQQGVKDQYLEKQLNNHWARESLAVLAHSGLLPTENFNPDDYVTVRQALPLLSAAVNHYSHTDMALTFDNIANDDPILPPLRHLVQLGMLERDEYIDPEGLLTRETLAVWLLKGMGYKSMANIPIKIENTFNDYGSITKGHQNYVALAAALEIIKGDKNGNFNPHQPITWGEFATIITRATPKLNTRN